MHAYGGVGQITIWITQCKLYIYSGQLIRICNINNLENIWINVQQAMQFAMHVAVNI